MSASALAPPTVIDDTADDLVETRERRILGVRPTSLARIAAPVGMGVLAICGWEAIVRAAHVPVYILPGPVVIAQAMVRDWPLLSTSLAMTISTSLLALLVAVIAGALTAIIFSQSKWIEMTFFPYAVIMQVTPIVAIAPLIILWVNNVRLALLICAWIIPFFPILSNTTVGLTSADQNLMKLFQIYRASRWQRLMRLQIPSAMPYFLAGLRISGGLSLVGAVVAEFVAGTGGSGSGLAARILEAGYQLKVPRLFAALMLISVAGIAIFLALSLLSHLCLRHWHESALKRET